MFLTVRSPPCYRESTSSAVPPSSDTNTFLQSWREILGALQWWHIPTLKQREHITVFPRNVAVPTCSRLCYRLRKVIFLYFLGITDFRSSIQSLQSAVVRASLILKLNPLAQGLAIKQPELGSVPELHILFMSILTCNSCLLPIFPLFFTPEENLSLSPL